ncbi:hypothetical protein PG275_09540 [Riemerella anatipestifer]|uniref:hypothetical protein n=1 Tax=Riemerella anatipestifer TaxID=34085 RepID=UPI002A863085|nr:hypothetical protein [Riemerella anatipestifer]
MIGDNKKENTIIPIVPTGLVKVGNSLAITNKILNEIVQRNVIDPLKWWQDIEDDLKIALYINLNHYDEIKVWVNNYSFLSFHNSELYESLKIQGSRLAKV